MAFFYRLVVAYDGTRYGGWQKQAHDITIAGTLEHIFKSTFYKEGHICGASRTDAGVHALGQVACIKTDLAIEPRRLKNGWNNRLPSDIVIRDITSHDYFSPFNDVALKTYYYHIFLERPLPHCARYGYFYRYPLSISFFEEALSLFVGTHDFRSFCTGNEHKNGTVRTITSISVDYLARYRVYRVTIEGEKFLRYMIRRIVGAALALATDKAVHISRPDCMGYLEKIFAARNPSHSLPTAPARGLMLRKIYYV